MPELPEVETVKEILKTQIIEKTIVDIDIYYEKVLENTTPIKLKEALINETITDLKRYGKYLMIIFKEHTLVCHLRMEGKFFLKDETNPIEKHEHLIFKFTDHKTLRYHDTRRFGKMVLLPTTDLEEIMKYKALKKLGIEANSPQLTGEYLLEKLKNKRIPIKTMLLNQEVLAGLGNIYVDEVCFLAKLNPLEEAKNLNITDANNIVKACMQTLTKAISEGGTTIRSYTSSLGVTGLFQQHLLVHTRVNQPCLTCGTTIKKIWVGGRGTYYCPTCQKLRQQVIGITGTIGTGKSTVINYLKEKKYETIECDLIVSELYQKEKVIQVIEEEFACVENKQVNRDKLRTLIFNDSMIKEKLEQFIHPLVKKEIKNRIKKSNSQVIFVDVPLLFEAGFEDLFNSIIVIYTNYLDNVQRLVKRNNISEEEAKKRISKQMDLIIKCAKSDFIIDNSQDLWYTFKQVDEILKNLN